MHNWLLKIDGIVDQEWVDLANEESFEAEPSQIPLPLQHLSYGMRDLQEQNQSLDSPATPSTEIGIKIIDQEGVNIVRLLSSQTFRDKLVIHLNIAFAGVFILARVDSS